jgi:two-component sensor histidine kinase
LISHFKNILNFASNLIDPKIVLLFLYLLIYVSSFAQKHEPGTALNFDGKDDYVILNNTINSPDFTLEIYFQIFTQTTKGSQAWDGNGLLFADAPGIANDFSLALLNNKVSFYDGDSDQDLISFSEIVDYKWHHLAVIRDSKKRMLYLYLDGNLEDKGASGIMKLDDCPTIKIGGHHRSHKHFCGNIDEVRIWNRVLTEDELLYNMHNELASGQDGLVSYFHFNQAHAYIKNEGTILFDQSGNQNHGKLVNFNLNGIVSNWIARGAIKSGDYKEPYVSYSHWYIIIGLIVFVTAAIYLFIKMRLRLLRKENQKLEKLVNARTSELELSLKEQMALTQEVHHRVKNNLQFIGAMLEMQINAIENESNQSVLKNTSRRIASMTLVHEMLYNKDKLESISLKEYLHELVTKFYDMIEDKNLNIHFKVKIEDLSYNINNSVAIGMITSELLSNSLKYAFVGIENPEIELNLQYDAEKKVIIYTIRDNGKGFDNKNIQFGLGSRLIDIFSRQLKGNFVISNTNGLTYKFEFPYTK